MRLLAGAPVTCLPVSVNMRRCDVAHIASTVHVDNTHLMTKTSTATQSRKATAQETKDMFSDLAIHAMKEYNMTAEQAAGFVYRVMAKEAPAALVAVMAAHAG